MVHRPLIDPQDFVGGIFNLHELRLQDIEILILQLLRVGQLEVLGEKRAVFVPLPSKRGGGDILSSIEFRDVVLLKTKLLLEFHEMLGSLRFGPSSFAGDDEDRRAVEPLERLLHSLGGQHALIVVFQNELRLVAEHRGTPNGHDAHRHERQRQGKLCQQQFRAKTHGRVSLSSSDTMCRSKPRASCTSRSIMLRPRNASTTVSLIVRSRCGRHRACGQNRAGLSRRREIAI